MSNEKDQAPAIMLWMSKNSQAVAAVIFITGAIFAALAVIFPFLLKENDRKVNTYIPVSAIVDTCQSRRLSSSRTNVNASVNNINVHYDVDGTTYHTYFADFDYSGKGLREGDSVTIYYNPDNPSESIAKYSPRVFMYTILLVIIFSLVAIFSVYSGVNILKRGIKVTKIDFHDWSKVIDDAPVRRVNIEYYQGYEEDQDI